MNKNSLKVRIKKFTGFSNTEIDILVNAIFDVMSEELTKGNGLSFNDYFKIYLKTKRNHIIFKPAKKLENKINLTSKFR